jgi:hypothetical protein
MEIEQVYYTSLIALMIGIPAYYAIKTDFLAYRARKSPLETEVSKPDSDKK